MISCSVFFVQLVRTAARYHVEKRVNNERAQKEEENKLKRIAATIAREIEYFWSNIEQVRVYNIKTAYDTKLIKVSP